MANVIPVFKRVRGEAGVDGWQVSWGPLTTTNVQGTPVGSPVDDPAGSGVSGLGQLAGYADKSMSIVGNFGGAAATLVLEGSNDGTNFFTLTNPLGTLISFSAAIPSLQAITEACIMLRPRISAGGDGATSLTVAMFFRKTQQP